MTAEKQEQLDKEFQINLINPYNSENYTITRNDYENLPDPMRAHYWTDEQMIALADKISESLAKYKFDVEKDDIDEIDDTFWCEMENCAVDMGMGYYEDDTDLLAQITNHLTSLFDWYDADTIAHIIYDDVKAQLPTLVLDSYDDKEVREAISHTLVKMISPTD